jgi:hypothetical protein
MNTWESFQSAYQKAPETVKAFIDSEEISIFCESLVSSMNLSLEQKSTLMTIISYTVLGINTKNEIDKLLMQKGFSFDDSNKIFDNISFFLNQKGFPVDLKVKQKISDAPKASLTKDTAGFHQSNIVRTMSHDMATIRPGSETVYRAASQADILEQAKEAAPAPPANTAPRWESETTS